MLAPMYLCGSDVGTGLMMVIVGKCLLAAPLLFCPCGGVGLPPRLFVVCGGSVVSPHVLIWTGVGSWTPPLGATGVLRPPPVPTAAIGKEVRAGPSFRGRRGRPFLFLFLIVKIAIKCCIRRLKEREYLRFRLNVLLF